jgi:hypothetical protein
MRQIGKRSLVLTFLLASFLSTFLGCSAENLGGRDDPDLVSSPNVDARGITYEFINGVREELVAFDAGLACPRE